MTILSPKIVEKKKQKKTMNKELSKYIAVFCHFGKASILLSVRSSGVSIVVFF